ncbi:hypothetical protein GGI25_005046 [Coemansia spiralis]|uniref:Uncharacterized protein n=2 Tax=Coemansia TaxID=4863 RepID=A0A9W8FZA9_9FUNG|nr:hypothetical protein EDC05_004898 [Coemansia umbellata]KAJ2620220.1 hypothetical protein GGI26_005177 [Coemansia sp. RSA 1358]KAJ2672548.1 hypothetical protein GGI25_005046 [Coemansia spiralis]
MYPKYNHSYSTLNDANAGDSADLEGSLMRGYSRYLLKFFQLLPKSDQLSLHGFSDALKNSRSSGRHLHQLYSALRKNKLHGYLTIHAFQQLAYRIASDPHFAGANTEEQPSTIIIQLISDYGEFGFLPSQKEYASLIRALAREPGREVEALQFLDELVESSELGPFIKRLDGAKWKHQQQSIADRIPSDEEILRIEASITRDEQIAKDGAAKGQTADDNAQISDDGEIEHEITPLDIEQVGGPGSKLVMSRIQALVVEKRRQRLAEEKASNRLLMPVSRYLYHMAMRGFAQIYNVRGVMEILNRMLKASTQVPYRIARHLTPNQETWNIISAVVVRQQDRPTFVKTWIEFLSRGARPPVDLTRTLIRMLVRQSCIEQAVWAMRISRALPDLGTDLPRAPHAADHVPWDLKVQIMYVASALEAATSFDATIMTRSDAIIQGKAAAQLPLLVGPDQDMYTHLISGAVRVGNERLARHLFEELISAGIMPEGAAYGRLASLYAQKGLINRVFVITRGVLARRYQILAQERLQQGLLNSSDEQWQYKRLIMHKASLLKDDVECFTPLLMLYIQNGYEREALALLRIWNRNYQKQVPADKLALALLKVYNRPEDASQINRLVRRALDQLTDSEHGETGSKAGGQTNGNGEIMLEGGEKPTPKARVFSESINTHIRARDLAGVVSVLRMIADHNMSPTHYVLEAAMRGFLKEQALDLFDAMHAYLRDTMGVPLSLPLYSMWMRQLRNHGDVPGIQAAFDELVELGQIPNQRNYLYLVQAYAYNGWIEQAVSIVKNLRKPQSVLRPGLELNIAVVEAYVACGNMELAEAEFHYLLTNTLIPRDRIPARPFNYLIIGYLFQGNGLRALHIYEEMIRSGVKPDSYTFAILMHSYALSGDTKNCTRVFNEMVRLGIVPDLAIYTILICAFATKGRVRRAELIFEQISKEQAWARAQAQHPSQNSRNSDRVAQQDTTSDSLNIYTEDPDSTKLSEAIDAFDIGSNSPTEHLRTNSFFNLDPIVYLAMLKLYRNTHRPMRALATWDKLIHNFPIVQWNPRKGGLLSKSLRYTAEFHIHGWNILTNTMKQAFGVFRVMKNMNALHRFILAPQYPEKLKNAVDERCLLKKRVASVYKANPDSSGITGLVHRFRLRSQLVSKLEKELDGRLSADHAFCLEQRFLSRTPAIDEFESFTGFDYWMPEDLNKDALNATKAPAGSQSFEPEPNAGGQVMDSESQSFINADGSIAQKSMQEIATIFMQKWRGLEETGFKFNNRQINDYIACMFLCRRYDEIIRLLSLIRSKSEPDSPKFRYYNLQPERRLTTMLGRQMVFARYLLLKEKDKRILLGVLLDKNSDVYQQYIRRSKFSKKNVKRNEDELQVMRERKTLHVEREMAWHCEMRMIAETARLWRNLVDTDKERAYITKAIALVDSSTTL